MKEIFLITGRVAVFLSIALLLIQSGGCTRSVQGAQEMTDLSSLEPLRQAFERDRGRVRLVALLSPV